MLSRASMTIRELVVMNGRLGVEHTLQYGRKLFERLSRAHVSIHPRRQKVYVFAAPQDDRNTGMNRPQSSCEVKAGLFSRPQIKHDSSG